MSAKALWNLAVKALNDHFSVCPEGGNTNHLKCKMCKAFARVEEAAWWAAKAESLVGRPTRQVIGPDGYYVPVVSLVPSAAQERAAGGGAGS